MDYKTLKEMDNDTYQEYLEDLSEDELNSLFDDIVQELSSDPEIASKVYWSDCDYFVLHNGNIYRMPQGADDLPKGGPYPTIISGLSGTEKDLVSQFVNKYGEDELEDLFDQLDDDFLCTFSDCPDYSDEEVLSSFLDDDEDEEDGNLNREMVNSLVDDIAKTNGIIESISDLSDKFRRLELDAETLYYRYDGEYYNLYENILEVGDDPRDYEEIEDILEYLLDLENRIVEADR